MEKIDISTLTNRQLADALFNRDEAVSENLDALIFEAVNRLTELDEVHKTNLRAVDHLTIVAREERDKAREQVRTLRKENGRLSNLYGTFKPYFYAFNKKCEDYDKLKSDTESRMAVLQQINKGLADALNGANEINNDLRTKLNAANWKEVNGK